MTCTGFSWDETRNPTRMIGQVVFNGLVTGMIVALPAVALTLTYSIAKFPNFAIGAMLTAGAYLAYTLNGVAGVPLLAAALLAAPLSAVLAVGVDQAIFRQLRDRTAITLLVASMGVSFILENIARFAFGNSARSFDVPIARGQEIFGLRMNQEQMISAATAVGAMALIYIILRHTALGRAMRAVADNAPLAAVRGIDREKIIRSTWAIAGLLTGASGVLIGMDRAIDPLLGWNYVVTVFAAAILGGLGNPLGAGLAALTVGVIEEASTLVIPPNYRQVVSFVAIALLLLLRPQGLLGVQRIRK
jgi:branched-subunit amino acid ABC-type transport system permease component